MVLGSKDLSCPNVVSHNASNASPLTPNLSHKCRLTAPRAKKNQFAKLKSNLHQKVQHRGNHQNFICSSNVSIINITNLTEFCGTKKPFNPEKTEKSQPTSFTWKCHGCAKWGAVFLPSRVTKPLGGGQIRSSSLQPALKQSGSDKICPSKSHITHLKGSSFVKLRESFKIYCNERRQ